MNAHELLTIAKAYESCDDDDLQANTLFHEQQFILVLSARPSTVDFKSKNQPFPHFFNRSMRSIGDDAYELVTELRNILFYGLLLVSHDPSQSKNDLIQLSSSVQCDCSDLLQKLRTTLNSFTEL